MKSSLDEKIQRAIKDNPDLPERFIREVLEACDDIKDLELLNRRLRKIGWDSFFRDEGGEELEFKTFEDLTIEVHLWIEAIQHFGTQERAMEWFRHPLKELNGTPPGEYCSFEPYGHRRVALVLKDIKEKTEECHEKGKKRLRDGEFLVEGELWLDAVDYFGSTDATIAWFQKPQKELGGESAYERCTNHVYGSHDVEKLLNDLKGNG
ncbi:antitoxin Xre/MbcA/ParS toxin-binding domain-containing protein [Neptuniibacter sp. QD29_5]|uniref:antitoxin Xre/MbcA/ParS toxin-binding domain-containing protein n=1 Tax=Neptuniibacter sp. QD29_5 TaxID=3398207 RepID=UPI0039F4E965